MPSFSKKPQGLVSILILKIISVFKQVLRNIGYLQIWIGVVLSYLQSKNMVTTLTLLHGSTMFSWTTINK